MLITVFEDRNKHFKISNRWWIFDTQTKVSYVLYVYLEPDPVVQLTIDRGSGEDGELYFYDGAAIELWRQLGDLDELVADFVDHGVRVAIKRLGEENGKE